MTTTNENAVFHKRAERLGDLIDLRECSMLTGLAMRTISQYVVLGLIPSVRFKHARLFVRTEIEEWMERRPRRRARPGGGGVVDYVDHVHTTRTDKELVS